MVTNFPMCCVGPPWLSTFLVTDALNQLVKEIIIDMLIVAILTDTIIHNKFSSINVKSKSLTRGGEGVL